MAVRLYALQSGVPQIDAGMARERPHYLLAGETDADISALAGACTSWLQIGANLSSLDLSLTTISRIFTSIGEYEGSVHHRDSVLIQHLEGFRDEIRSTIRVNGEPIREEQTYNLASFNAAFFPGDEVVDENGETEDPFRAIRCGDALQLTEAMFALLMRNRGISITINSRGDVMYTALGTGNLADAQTATSRAATQEAPASDPNIMQRSFRHRPHAIPSEPPSGGPVETRPSAPVPLGIPPDVALENAVLRALMDIDGHAWAQPGDVPRVPDVPGLIGRPYAVAYHDEVRRIARLIKAIDRVQVLRATGAA